jgi:2-keto-4-pentenoate hydratase/2-oxohepta-3-ene-1,7-dioic acid hydratase in catechol pathway
VRLCRFSRGDADAVGLVEGDRVVPIDAPSILDVINGGKVRIVGEPVPLGDVALLAPLRPGKLIGVGLNYRAHAIETGKEIPTQPLLFHKFSSAVTAPGGPVELPNYTHALDYEGELVVVIGRRAKSVPVADALSYVFGYGVMDDISARDLQRAEPQWLLAKSGDTFAPWGPWVTTSDEVPDPQALSIRTWINDELRQDGNTNDMVFPVAELVAYISARIALEPGDMITTGTPAGVGDGFDPPRHLGAGDHVKIEIAGLGAIEHDVVAAR